MITIILIFSTLINFLLLFYINKKKIRNFLNITKINKASINDLHEIFSERKISSILKGPKKEIIVKNFCISSDNDIVGMTSDYEAWILSVLSTVSKKIFEFGTCSGKTTYLMALNSNINTEITTITLRQNQIEELVKDHKDNKVSFKNIIDESIYEKFLFSDTDVEKKIKVIFENSLNFNEDKYQNMFDLIFIDGGHTYSIVKNDSEKSFRMLKDEGIVLWHDYVPGKESAKNVVKYLNEISNKKKLFHIKNTSLCFYKKNT